MSFQQDIEVAIREYQTEGKRPLHEDICEERRKLQNPSVFAVPTIEAKPWWELADLSSLLRTGDPDILDEFRKYKSVLKRDNITKDVVQGQWTAYYLMEEGVWNRNAQSYFTKTNAMLLHVPIFETG